MLVTIHFLLALTDLPNDAGWNISIDIICSKIKSTGVLKIVPHRCKEALGDISSSIELN